jgi:hypothetical protein
VLYDVHFYQQGKRLKFSCILGICDVSASVTGYPIQIPICFLILMIDTRTRLLQGRFSLSLGYEGTKGLDIRIAVWCSDGAFDML